jgi:hypothetical protein
MSDTKQDKRTPGPEKKFLPDLKEVEKLCRLNCTDDELAAFFGVCRKTVERERKSNPEFNEVIERGKSFGKLSLRRRQVELANKGNPTMLIWLGKVYLKQRENVTVDANVTTVTMSPEEYKQARNEAMDLDDC